MDVQDRALRDRVVVFGLPADSVQNVLRKFQEFGDIVDYHVGQGNWMIIRYATALQAEKALSQTSVLLSSNVLLGVMKLTSQLARRLNIQVRVRMMDDSCILKTARDLTVRWFGSDSRWGHGAADAAARQGDIGSTRGGCTEELQKVHHTRH